jgi:hypothetical protein
MPHEQVVDHANRLVVIRFFGEGTLEDLSDAARCLLQDQSIGTGYGLMLVGDDYALYPTLDDLLNIVSLLKESRAVSVHGPHRNCHRTSRSGHYCVTRSNLCRYGIQKRSILCLGKQSPCVVAGFYGEVEPQVPSKVSSDNVWSAVWLQEKTWWRKAVCVNVFGLDKLGLFF